MLRKTVSAVATLIFIGGGVAVIASAFEPSADTRAAQTALDGWEKQIGRLGPLQQRTVREHGGDVTWYFADCQHPADPTTPAGPALPPGTSVDLVKLPADPGTNLITVYTSGGAVRAEDDLRHYTKTRPDPILTAVGSALVLLGLGVGLYAGGWIPTIPLAQRADGAFPVV